MDAVRTIHDVTEHMKVYLLAGTLVAVGVDVAGNVSGSMGAPVTMSMVPMMPEDPLSGRLALGVERGVLYVAISSVIGLAVNAVYLALVT